jgi:hypothetical protein
MAEGMPVHGNSLWSAQDNQEWVAGYGDASESSTSTSRGYSGRQKLSGQWFREAARLIAVV